MSAGRRRVSAEARKQLDDLLCRTRCEVVHIGVDDDREAIRVEVAERPRDLVREDERQHAQRAGAHRQLGIGALLLLVGIVVTAGTYASASSSGGSYVVAYGAIVVGIIKIIRGAIGLSQNR